MKNANVAVVGSGVAGVTVADILLKRGTAERVTIFEAAPPMRMMHYRTWLDFLTTGQRPTLPYTDDKADIEGDPSSFYVPGGRLFVVGGSTVHWGGWCPRFKPEDFELKSRTGFGLDWQISYEELRPYYDKAEHRIRVAGDSKREDPPRNGSQFPVEPVPLTQMDEPVIRALKDLEYGNFGNISIARNEQCATTGTCRYCPIGGRYDTTMDIRALSGNVVLKANSPVTEILMRSKNTASGLRYRDLNQGLDRVEDFDQVFVCAGTIESAKLLLMSQSVFWPNGIGNDTGHVGSHLISHPRIRSIGTFPKNEKGYSQELNFPTLECRHFDTPQYQKDGKLYFVRDDRDSTIDFAKELVGGKKAADLNQQLVGPVQFTLSGFVEEFESPGNRVELSSGSNRFGLPRTKINYRTPEITLSARMRHLAHMDEVLLAMGIKKDAIAHDNKYPPRCDHAVATCRMSKSASEGVVDSNLRVHDCENVFVCSNAVFPNVAAVNPTLTLTALSIRLAESV